VDRQEEGDVVGAQVETGFDYRTVWRLARVEERPAEVLEQKDLPVFTPEGTRMRDERGRAIHKRGPWSTTKPRVFVRLEAPGREPRELEVPSR